MESRGKDAQPSAQRTAYPAHPSARVAAARREHAVAVARARKIAWLKPTAAAKEPVEPPKCQQPAGNPLLTLRTDLAPSGALLLHPRQPGPPRWAAWAPAAPADPATFEGAARAGAENDLSGSEMPTLGSAFTDAVCSSMDAGCWALARALAERLPEVSAEARTLDRGGSATWRCPALGSHRLPDKRFRPCAAPVRPWRQTSLPWAACSEGARLKYAGTTVVRFFDRKADVTVGESRPIYFRQQWPRAFAVGSFDAFEDWPAEGTSFSVSVDLDPEEELKGGKRPSLHIGVTSVAASALDAVEGNCWLISTCGQAHSCGEAAGTVPVAWPAPSRDTPSAIPLKAAVRPRVPRFELVLFVTEDGALRFTVGGSLAASSHVDLVPRSLAREPTSLLPMVVLGPNVEGVTLRAPASLASPAKWGAASGAKEST
mmetsp:Transcript_13369/g.35902  ORF Transcript_13369/g.35902 Transcript_13369/m.35902 type:complete len:430 (-) Transcript_13369:139-1428(-)